MHWWHEDEIMNLCRNTTRLCIMIKSLNKYYYYDTTTFISYPMEMGAICTQSTEASRSGCTAAIDMTLSEYLVLAGR